MKSNYLKLCRYLIAVFWIFMLSLTFYVMIFRARRSFDVLLKEEILVLIPITIYIFGIVTIFLDRKLKKTISITYFLFFTFYF